MRFSSHESAFKSARAFLQNNYAKEGDKYKENVLLPLSVGVFLKGHEFVPWTGRVHRRANCKSHLVSLFKLSGNLSNVHILLLSVFIATSRC